jgi:sugar phosphate isomerase/epimerase
MHELIIRREPLKPAGAADLVRGLVSQISASANEVTMRRATRRWSILTVAALVGMGALPQDTASAASAADRLGWQLSIHAYTFGKFSIFECIDKTAALGLKYMSLSGSVNLDGTNTVTTVKLSDQDAEAIRTAAAARGIKLVNIGVVTLPPNEAESRRVFEFARKIGIDTLVAEPEPAALDTVERLCKEYNIKVAIHNHPKPSHYWNPDTVLEAVQGRTPLMGACADTGHWLRSGLDPVECLKKLQGRVITLHFKDLVPDEPQAQPNAPATGKKKQSESKAMHDVPWGTGVGNLKAQMAELKRQGFHGAFGVEYEFHWDNSMPEIAKCVEFFNATCSDLAKSP